MTRQQLWKARNRKAAAAHEAVRRAVIAGTLVRKPCAECGYSTAHAHHSNGYDAAHVLDVVWLCSIHHYMTHAGGLG